MQIDGAYDPPEWASSPPVEYKLEVYRASTELDSIDVSRKDHYLFGRNADACDVETGHPSCSRCHCVLQHGEEGAFLYDLGSTHGTFLNKQRIPPREFVRVEPGAQFRVGQSSRIYVLVAPEDSSDGDGSDDAGEATAAQGGDLAAAERRRQELEERWRRRRERRAKRALAKARGGDGGEEKEEEEAGGISWGMDDAEVGADGDGDGDDGDAAGEEARREAAALLKGLPESELPEYLRKHLEEERRSRARAGLPDEGPGLRESDVSARDREAWERVKAKREKAENLHEEAGRIRRKMEQQSGELTEGQTRRLDQIEKHIQKLSGEIQEAEQAILDKNQQRGASRRAASLRHESARHVMDNDDAEEASSFYDQAASRRLAARAGGPGRSRFVFRGGKMLVDRDAMRAAKRAREEAEAREAAREARREALAGVGRAAPGGGDDVDGDGHDVQPETFESARAQRQALEREIGRVQAEMRVLRESAEEQRLAVEVGSSAAGARSQSASDAVDDLASRSKAQVFERRAEALSAREAILRREAERIGKVERLLRPELDMSEASEAPVEPAARPSGDDSSSDGQPRKRRAVLGPARPPPGA